MKIYLPRLMGSADCNEEVEAETVPGGHREEAILLVEDDDGVRDYTAGILRELGYSVVEAHDGAAGLKQLERHASIKLLFIDVGLPGMNGRELANEARKRRSGLTVHFASGYARNAIVHQGGLDPGAQMIGNRSPMPTLRPRCGVSSTMPADRENWSSCR